MDAKDLFPPSDYMKSEDIDAAGGEMTVTITAVGRKEFEENGKKSVKGILSFAETPKKLTTNTTNTNIIASMYGDENIDVVWLGKKITLYVDENVQFGGKQTRGIRVKNINEKQAASDAFWAYAADPMYLSPEEGRAILKENGGDFVKALAVLKGETPIAKQAKASDINKEFQLGEQADHPAIE